MQKKQNKPRIFLTANEKKAITMPGVPPIATEIAVEAVTRKARLSQENVLREQRDQAHFKIRDLERQIDSLKQRNEHLGKTLANMTVWRLLRYEIAKLIRPKES